MDTIGSKPMVTFHGVENRSTLTIAVSQLTTTLRGLSYPPAFGTMLAVNTTRGNRVCILPVQLYSYLCRCALLSFISAAGWKQKNTFLFGRSALPCAACHPILCFICWLRFPYSPGTRLNCSVSIWLPWLIIVLQNRICRPGFLPAAISNGVGAAFLVYAFLYGMMASHLSLGAIRFFSASVFCYKAASALYLLIIAVLCHSQRKKRSRPIFYAAAAATCAFIWDRLLPVI